MVWISETQDEVGLFREIATHSDRVVGILAPVVLERRLMSVIKSRWKDTKTRGGTLFGELFSTNGELGNHDHACELDWRWAYFPRRVLKK